MTPPRTRAGRARPSRPRPTTLSVSLALAALAPLAYAAPPLPPGTLPQLRGVVSGAAVGVPSLMQGSVTLPIVQSAQRAIIDWNSFNVSADARVQFLQPNAGAAALNRIFDANPSIIQGRIEANGQVYLINQNGIIFDRGSQVNVHSLVASTLAMREDVFLAGLNAPRLDPAFEGIGAAGPRAIELLGVIRTAPGGAVMVISPQINNQGAISAPDGQIILAAGERVWLEQSDPTDTSLRGLRVEFRAGAEPVNLSSVITNGGQLEAARGNVSLAALAINQSGRVTADTAVLQNGSIFLRARERPDSSLPARRGEVLLGAGSVTATPLDLTDTTTLADDQSFTPYRPRIEIEGRRIHNQGQIVAPGGVVNITATLSDVPAPGETARVLLDQGSLVSAAGTWADVPATKNLLEVQITSNELRDAPLQRGGVLQGATVVVDARKGTPLFDISSKTGGIKRTIAEKTATAGEVAIRSDGDIVIRDQATIDVSGGAFRYGPEALYTSKLLTEDNRIVDIGSAQPDVRYKAVLDSFEVNYRRWGVTEIFRLLDPVARSAERPDVDGAAGGTLTLVSGAGTVVDGQLLGGISAGRAQIQSGRVPRGARLVAEDTSRLDRPQPDFATREVVFTRGPSMLSSGFGLDDPLPASLQRRFTLPFSFFQDYTTGANGQYRQLGFSDVELYADERIALAADEVLRMPVGGALTLGALNVDVAGRIIAPAGRISLSGIGAPASGALPAVNVAPTAELLARGVWVNDAAEAGAAQAPAPLPLPRSINGGTVQIVGGDIALAAGSTVDVSSGARWNGRALSRGNGGSIVLRSGSGRTDGTGFGEVDVQGRLLAYGAGRGGRLDVLADRLQVGGAAPGDPAVTHVTADRFSTSGVSDFVLRGFSGVEIAPGTPIQAAANSQIIDVLRAAAVPTAGDIGAATRIGRLPETEQPASTVAITAGGPNGTLTMRDGSSVSVGPRGKVTLTASENLNVLGAISAPAGEIVLNATASAVFPDPQQALVVGSTARLSAPGYFQSVTDDRGLVSGEALRAGTILLTASGRQVVVERGAVFDVSAADGAIDVRSGVFPSSPVTRQAVRGDAGVVGVTALDRAIFDGTVLAAASPGGAGGTFAFDLLKPADATLRQTDRRLTVSAAPAADRAPRAGVVDGYVSLDGVLGAGVDKVRLRSDTELEFRGDVRMSVNRSLRLDAPVIGASDGASVSVSAPRVALGASPDDANRTAVPRVYATRAGTARLAVEAGTTGVGDSGLLDLYGTVTLNGFEAVSLRSNGDLRLTGDVVNAIPDPLNQVDRITGSLTTTGNLRLQADQIYPTTLTQYTMAVKSVDAGGAAALVPDGRIDIAANAAPAHAPLSAGGTLRLEAADIVQGGTVKAPLGGIAMVASRSVVLAPGSTTSVAGAAGAVPYGSTQFGQTWTYADIALSGVNAKRIDITAPTIRLEPGSIADLRGGGSVLGYEFFAGPGGSTDTLLDPGTFAILPFAGRFGPLDTQMNRERDLGFGVDRNVYDSVYLAGMPGLPAGEYVLLPGHYALLPGAYIVRPQSGAQFRDMRPEQQLALTDGTPVVAGYRTASGANVRESRWSGFAVEPGSAAAKRSEYVLSDASFFADAARRAGAQVPPMPADAGRLALNASQAVALGGEVLARQTAGGRGGAVSITSESIAVVGATQQAPTGFLSLSASALTALEAGLYLNAGRDLIVDAAGSAFTAPEIILAAGNDLTVRSGSAVLGTGGAGGIGESLALSGPGALLRVAGSDAPFSFTRANASPSATGPGRLTVEGGATIGADGAAILDATNTTLFDGALQIAAGGSLFLGSRSIGIGDAAPASGGLRLDSARLASLRDLTRLDLRSYTSVDLYGAVTLGDARLGLLTIDAAALQGFGNAQDAAVLAARTVSFANSVGTAPGGATGAGALTVVADTVRLGAGEKRIEGFATTRIDAASAIALEGTGSLQAAGDLGLLSPQIVTGARADQRITAAGALSTGYSSQPSRPQAAVALPAASVVLAGRTVTHGGRLEAPSGRVLLRSTGGDALVAAGGVVDAAAYQRVLGDGPVSGAGGRVTLEASGGDARIAAGSLIDVSGAPSGGAAGSVVVTNAEAGRTVSIEGTLAGTATRARDSGSFAVDGGALGDLAALNALLDAGGFFGSREFRAREGDVAVASGTSITARRVKLVADGGAVSVSGRIDASGIEGGGSIELVSRDDMTLAAGSALVARGTGADASSAAPYASGGRVEVETTSGTLRFALGASIDVSAGAKGDGGEVRLVAPRSGTAIATDLRGAIAARGAPGGSPGSVAVLGERTHDVSTVNAGVVATNASNPVWNEHQAFVSGVSRATVLGALTLEGVDPGTVAVQGAVTLQSPGDMTVSSNWDLASAGWTTGGQPGRLTLRAGGDIDVRTAIGFQNDNLALADSWTIRLVGGADLSSADRMRVLRPEALAPGKGSVRLSQAASAIRTGTGDISIAAAADVVLGNATAVVYTSGKPLAGGTATDRNAVGGGDVTVAAGRDIVGPNREIWVNDWLQRTIGTSPTQIENAPAAWFPNRPTVRQVFGALGGGDIVLSADRDIVNAHAIAPTSASVSGAGAASSLDVFGGGDLAVTAGRSIVGGQYLIGRGTGELVAGNDVGGPAGTSLFLQGLHNDPALAGARFRVQAGGDLVLANASNPTILALSSVPGAPAIRTASTFFSYSPDARVELRSLSGDIELRNTAPTRRGVGNRPIPTAWSDIAPPQLEAVAIEGDVYGAGTTPVASRLRLFPSSSGSVDIRAGGEVYNVSIEALDAAPATLPSWDRPFGTQGEAAVATQRIELGALADQRLVVRNELAGQPYKVFSVRDIVDTQLVFPQRSSIVAGRDIVNLQADLQNIDTADASEVIAGRDLRYSDTYRTGGVAGNSGGYLRIGGPGRLTLQAGRFVELGVTEGITAGGNSFNASLGSPDSARLAVLAGVTGRVDAPGTDAFFAELLAAGLAEDTVRANAAIDRYFEGKVAEEGGLSMFFSAIKTQGGSGIDVLVPAGTRGPNAGGTINAGLPTRVERDIGVLTVLGGDIRVFAGNDVLVNQSKISTLQGGDILIYSKLGDIDAGRGARDARTTQPPRRVPITAVDPATGQEVETGLFAYVPPLDAAGSGIRTFTSDPDGPGPLRAPPPGNVFLFAPSGVINAGEAGIASAGNVVLVATQVLNAQNITATGTATGVPVSTDGAVAGALAASAGAASAATQQATETARQATQSAPPPADTFRPSFISVEVLGFGD
jgi:filamentous hemagglutinin family protein